MGAGHATFTPWETRIGAKVECLRCDYTALCGLPSDAIQAAKGHAEETGHTVNITKVQHRTVSGGALRLVAPAVGPNPHEQSVWDARTAC